MTDKIKILIIDANNMFFRAYCASPALNSNGEHIGGILGFLYSLQKRIKDVDPHNVFIVWDGKGGSKKRREIREDYKDGRKPPKPLRLNRAHDIERTEEEETKSLYYQQSVLIELLTNLPYMQVCEPGVEADDFISYICNKYNDKDKYIKVIVSNDKDFIQLTNESTLLFRPAEDKYVTYKSWIEENKIHPVNMALSRAIEGDNADNLDGVKGVGRKTIAKKYPFLSENKHITLTEFKEILIDHEKNDCTTSSKILESFDKVQKNYEIMQLHVPMIPAISSQKISEDIAAFVPSFNTENFKNILTKEGISGGFQLLYNHCYKLTKENWYGRNS